MPIPSTGSSREKLLGVDKRCQASPSPSSVQPPPVVRYGPLKHVFHEDFYQPVHKAGLKEM